jgi:uncharacterized membrane protein YeaQ/YmgE (transglycosylase-associated protein family)
LPHLVEPDFPRSTELHAAAQNWNGRPQLPWGPIPAEGTLSIIWIIIIGFLAGVVARLLSPGPNNPTGFILTTVLGIVGAFVATFLGQAVGWYRADQGAGLIGATVGAILILFIWNRLVANRTISDPGVTGRRWL